MDVHLRANIKHERMLIIRKEFYYILRIPIFSSVP